MYITVKRGKARAERPFVQPARGGSYFALPKLRLLKTRQLRTLFLRPSALLTALSHPETWRACRNRRRTKARTASLWSPATRAARGLTAHDQGSDRRTNATPLPQTPNLQHHLPAMPTSHAMTPAVSSVPGSTCSTSSRMTMTSVNS